MWNPIIDDLTAPGLSPRGKQLLISFINLSDRSLAHPLTWKRFYGFVRYAHAHRAALKPHTLLQALKMSGFKYEDAQRLSFLYEHGRAILKKGTPIFHSGRFWD